MKTLATVTVLACWAFGVQIAAGHAVFMSYVEHRARAVVGPDNMDLRIDLTFFEIRSMAERRRMDANGDNRISADETRDYLKKVASTVAGAVQLRVDGRFVDLVPLYEPEIDLLGVTEVAPSHLLLRLFYFARTPSWLTAGSEIVFEDCLWPQAAAIRAFEVVGRDGCQMTSQDQADPLSGPDVATGPQRFAARCAAIPRGAGTQAHIAAAGVISSGTRSSIVASAPQGGRSIANAADGDRAGARRAIADANTPAVRLYPASLVALAITAGTVLFCFVRRNRQESRNDADTDSIGGNPGP